MRNQTHNQLHTLLGTFTLGLVAFVLALATGCGGNEAQSKLEPEDEPTTPTTQSPDASAATTPNGSRPSVKPGAAPGTVDTHIQQATHVADAPQVVVASAEDERFAREIEELGGQAAMLEQQQKFAEAAVQREVIYEKVRAKYGDDSWQTVNALMSWEQTKKFVALSPEERAVAETITQFQETALAAAAANQFDAAAQALAQAADASKQFWGEESHLTARVIYRQGELQRALGNFPSAVAYYQAALAIEDKAIGRHHPRTIELLSALASTALTRGQLAEAEAWQLQTVDAAEKAYGREAIEYTATLRDLATVRQAQGMPDEAVRLYERVLELRLKSLGSLDPLVAESSYELARALYQAERFDEAIPKLRETIAQMNQSLGGAHHLTLIARNNLAMALVAKGEFEEAEEILLELLEVRRTLVGDQHPDYATAQHHLAILYANQGDMPEAEPYVLSAMKIYQRKLGPGHPLLAETIKTYAAMLRHSGQIVKAEQLETALREMADAARGIQGPLK